MMHIIIDSREDIEKIKNILKQNKHVSFEVKQLKHGDFILNSTIIFERKTLSNFIISIKDGRLFRQGYKAITESKPYILILEGIKSSITGSRMSREAVQGALVHLSVFMGIPILRTKDLTETLSLIVAAGKQEEKILTKSNRSIYSKHQKARKSNIKKLQVQVLQNFPGVGKQRALDILANFGSLKDVFNATEKQLCNVQGIGKKTARNILKMMNTDDLFTSTLY